MTLPHGEVIADSELRGVALWTPPGKWKAHWWQHLMNLGTWLSVIGASRFFEVVNATDEIATHHPKEPHYYLFYVGVDPQFQGHGIGKALINPVLDKADREKTFCYLEASHPDNIPLYERLGFVVKGEIKLGGDGPTIVPMVRQPKA